MPPSPPSSPPPAPPTLQLRGPAQGPLGGVVSLYLRRYLLPDTPDGEDVVLKLLSICRQQLVQHSGALPAVGPLAEGGPSLGELLAWAFRDAPSLLSDPQTLRQMESLPLAALEALLSCDAFATDDEASVLLLVAYWLVASYKTTADVNTTRVRACKLVRLSQLSSTFLHVVLPSCLAWFPITPEEHRFLCDYAAAPPAQRARMAAAAAGLYDCSSAWYTAPARPRLPPQSLRRYEWMIQGRDLDMALAHSATVQSVNVPGKFASGADRVMSHGLEWYPHIRITTTTDNRAVVGAYLLCNWPSVVGPVNPDKIVALVRPGPLEFRVDQARSDTGGGQSVEPAWRTFFGLDSYVRVGLCIGGEIALPQLAAEAAGQLGGAVAAGCGGIGSFSGDGGGASAVSPWVPYLRDGCLHGSLQWTW